MNEMNLLSISKVSKEYDISTRTLRYYEQIGLIKSLKIEDYAYRMYDEEALIRLRQIMVLRKLRIPLKQISNILDSRNGQRTIEIFQENIKKIDEEAEALEIIKKASTLFVQDIADMLPKPISADTFDDDEIRDLIRTISIQTLNKKEIVTMNEIDQANKTVDRIKDMRIIYVPPMQVASFHLKGENKEDEVNKNISEFITSNNLVEKKPDFRRIGFNNPAGDNAGSSLGYESWVSIPEDMEVQPPFVKKKFQGGVYAAKMIRFGEFQEWGNLWQWVMTNNDYDLDYAPRVDPGGKNADPALEEQLDAMHHIDGNDPSNIQLDLLIPIKEKGERLICQSCGMDIADDKLKGTNEDGSLSEEYCSFCYQNGKFTNDRTIDEQVELGLNYSEEYKNAQNDDEKDLIKAQTRKYLSGLKRWKEN